MNKVTSDTLLSPIKEWLSDDAVSEIVLNDPGKIFVERANFFASYQVPEFHQKRLQQLFRLIANENHQELNEEKPLLSGVLQNGSRVQLIIPPVSSSYCFAIRKQRRQQWTLDDLVNQGCFRQTEMFNLRENTSNMSENDESLHQFYQQKKWRDFIRLALLSRKNIVISGATSTGKTAFLNACVNELPKEERLLILEDTAEIQHTHSNVVRLLASKNQQGLSQVTMQDLVQCSLRLRPDRIIVGEVRGKELLDYIAASLTGHSGTITSIHAENPKIAFTRMCQMYKLNALPAMTDQDIYGEIKQAVDIIFQLKRTKKGRQLDSVYFNRA